MCIEGDVELWRAPYSRRLARKVGAELPSVPVRKKTEEGEEVERLGKPEPPALRKGMTPLKQLIYYRTPTEGMEEEDVKSMVDDTRWFEGLGDFSREIEQAFEDLKELGLMTVGAQGKWHSIPAEIEGLGDEGYPIEVGPYPVLRLIRDSTKIGISDRDKIAGRVHQGWSWTNSRSAADYWIEVAEDRNFIREVERDRYEPFRPVEW